MNAKEIRKQKCFERLGSNHPVCIICGEADWRCLEEHHIAGKAYADDLAIICRNCHRKVSDDQKDHPKKLSVNPTQSEVIGRFLLGVADLFELIINQFRAYGNYLIKNSRNLDKEND